MYIGSVDEEYYNLQMEQMKHMVDLYHSLKHSDIYNAGCRYKRYSGLFKGNLFKNLFLFVRDKVDYFIFNKKKAEFEVSPICTCKSNYFSNKRIAVYTCVFGNYDTIIDPISCPDNIDYFVISDSPDIKSKIWKKLDVSKYSTMLSKLSNVEKNRWFKMHPFELFGDKYQYSIYIDGNIRPITDFTEFVNKLGECGIAMFSHKFNDCVFQEALNNYYLIKKTPKNQIKEQISYLRGKGMPEHYGMTTCNVIVRDHKNPIVRKLMDDWWEEFMLHCRRDQLSFPYVVWKNGIQMSDIATLGNDVWNADSLMVVEHI